jgi:hypothetical protein
MSLRIREPIIVRGSRPSLYSETLNETQKGSEGNQCRPRHTSLFACGQGAVAGSVRLGCECRKGARGVDSGCWRQLRLRLAKWFSLPRFYPLAVLRSSESGFTVGRARKKREAAAQAKVALIFRTVLRHWGFWALAQRKGTGTIAISCGNPNGGS